MLKCRHRRHLVFAGLRFWIDAVLDMYFVGDIVINFRTAYFDVCSQCCHCCYYLTATCYLHLLPAPATCCRL